MKPKKLSILLVDDEEGLCIPLSTLLERKSYAVIPYSDMDQAYDDIDKKRVDYGLAVVDLAVERKYLHEGSVLTKCRYRCGEDIITISKIRFPTVKIIATSGNEDIQHSADYFLKKPFKDTDLIDLIERMRLQK